MLRFFVKNREGEQGPLEVRVQEKGVGGRGGREGDPGPTPCPSAPLPLWTLCPSVPSISSVASGLTIPPLDVGIDP